jgi:DNA-binding response OmpR family regulator
MVMQVTPATAGPGAARRVLVVEDDPDIGRLVTLQLAELGCESRLVDDGVTGLAEAQDGRYDLVILDLMLPRLDGLQICRRLRAAERHTPILMLTAKSSELDRVLGLELGADDYLTKPFSMLELAARVKGVFRRAELVAAARAQEAPQGQLIERGALRIDLQRHEARLQGQPLELTAKEFELLAHFARAGPRVHARAVARPGLGLPPQRLRAHRQLAHQPAAQQDRARPGQPRVHPDRLGRRLPVRRALGLNAPRWICCRCCSCSPPVWR